MRHNPPECALVFAVGESKMQMECGRLQVKRRFADAREIQIDGEADRRTDRPQAAGEGRHRGAMFMTCGNETYPKSEGNQVIGETRRKQQNRI